MKHKIKVGNVYSELQFYKVLSITPHPQGDVAEVSMTDGTTSKLGVAYISDHLCSADSFDDTVRVTASELSRIVLANPLKAITVNFNKKLNVNELVNKITACALHLHNSGVVPQESDFEGAVTFQGNNRTMRGYHNGQFTPASRLVFNDMDVTDVQSRQVDLRTLNYTILDGVKYILK